MDYLRTARAKGLDERKIIIRHALSNCWLPIITVLGPISASILTGSFITEHFFAIPGMAKYFISAVFDRDVFLMMGVTLVFSSILIFLNLAVEILAPWIDPRVQKEWS
jgi:ABC-type dipeptide/oligopeptide/nickel transport system permease component